MIYGKHKFNRGYYFAGKFRRGIQSRGWINQHDFDILIKGGKSFVIELEVLITPDYVVNVPFPAIYSFVISNPYPNKTIECFVVNNNFLFRYVSSPLAGNSGRTDIQIPNIRNQWQKIIASYDPLAPLVKYFVDGIKTEANNPVFDVNYDITFNLGHSVENNNGEINGGIRNVRIYSDIALSDSEAAILQNGGTYLPTTQLPANLLNALQAEYKCNQTAGSILYDSHSNKHLLPSAALKNDYRARVSTGEKFNNL